MFEAELVKQTFKLLSNTFVIIDLIFWLVLGLYLLPQARSFESKIEFSPFSPFFNVYRESLIVYIRSLIFLIIRSKIHNISVTRELTAFISHDLPYLFLMFGHAKGTLERTKFRKQAWRLHDLKKNT